MAWYKTTRKRKLFCQLSAILFLSASVFNTCSAIAAANTPIEEQQYSVKLLHISLSPTSRDMAELLGVMPIVEKLDTLQLAPLGNESKDFEHVRLKQQLLEKVIIATLQVRDVTARIDRELARLDRKSGYLENKRDRAIKLNSMANLFGTGLVNEVGQAGEMKVKEAPGEITELVGGGLSMVLAGRALMQQSGSKERVRAKPNMLAKIFNCPTDKNTEYPDVVWNYLNRVPPEDLTHQTRLEALLHHWEHYRLISNTKTAAGRKRIAILTNTGQYGVASIALIDDQSALLSDLKAEVFQLDRDLLELLLNTQAL